MFAKHIMSTDVFTIRPETTIHELAVLLSEHHLRAVPVVTNGKIVGVVSASDLLNREEIDTDAIGRHFFLDKTPQDKSTKITYVKEHGKTVQEVMTQGCLTCTEHRSLRKVARKMKRNNVTQLFVMRNDKLVGRVDQSSLVKALAKRPEGAGKPSSYDDDQIEITVRDILNSMPEASPWKTKITVKNRIVYLYGTIENGSLRVPSFKAIQELECVIEVHDHRNELQPY